MSEVTQPLRISNLFLRDGKPVAEPDLAADSLAGLQGHFALHQRGPDGVHHLARDPLGVNKLFFALRGELGVESSNYLFDLVKSGHPLSAIWSVPSGHRLRLRPERREWKLDRYNSLPFNDGDEPPIAESAVVVRSALETTFRGLREALAGKPLYVTMSGGLDSTQIAVLAREWLGDFVGVTFACETAPGTGPGDSDLAFASRAAADLGVPLEQVCVSADELVSLLDEALLYGQDWRDFNVHCALVNAAIGRRLACRHAEGPRPVLLTGDTMNELMADYKPVSYGGREHYRLPRLPARHLRRFLVDGLDAGDREVGVFAHHGLDTVQPYALCADAYTAISGQYVEKSDAKQELVRRVMGPRVPEYVYERPKVRAQVASSDPSGGTLAALVDRGIHSETLAARFAELVGAKPEDLQTLVRAGHYRFTAQYPEPTH